MKSKAVAIYLLTIVTIGANFFVFGAPHLNESRAASLSKAYTSFSTPNGDSISIHLAKVSLRSKQENSTSNHSQTQNLNVNTKTHADFMRALAYRESSGNYEKMNPHGYAGAYQMGELALRDAGYYAWSGAKKNAWKGEWTGKDNIHSLQDFLKSPQIQDKALTIYHQKLWAYLKDYHHYEGQIIGGILLTKSGMIAASHLVGHGKFKQFINTNGKVNPVDGNRVPSTEYLKKFEGYSI